MITGHLGVAAAARSRWGIVPLVWLLLASLAPDLLDAAYAITGTCNPYGLFSHTVPAVALVAAAMGGATFLVTGSAGATLLTVGMVLSHLLLDLVTGHKILWPGGPLVGLSFYDRHLLDFIIEAPLALGGWWLLRRSGRGPRWATLGVVALGLVVVQAGIDLRGRGFKPTACPGIGDVAP